MGMSPYLAPAIFSLVQYAEFADGIWLPKGGMYSVVQALVTVAKKWGVRFIYNAPVARIDVQGNKSTGVTLVQGEHQPADVVVANADLPYVYRALLPSDGTARRLERKKYGCSALLFLWGLDTVFPRLGAHNLFFAPNIEEGFGPLFDERGLPEDPHFYVHAPTRVDASMAPEGHDTWFVAVPVGHLRKEAPQNWPELQQRARQAVLRRLVEFGLVEIEKHIKFELSFGPLDWRDQYHLVKGSTHGLSHNLSQMAYLRPHNRHKRYRNLYFVGASTHPGTGVPSVLVSAGLAANRILREIGVPGSTNPEPSEVRLGHGRLDSQRNVRYEGTDPRGGHSV